MTYRGRGHTPSPRNGANLRRAGRLQSLNTRGSPCQAATRAEARRLIPARLRPERPTGLRPATMLWERTAGDRGVRWVTEWDRRQLGNRETPRPLTEWERGGR